MGAPIGLHVPVEFRVPSRAGGVRGAMSAHGAAGAQRAVGGW